MKIFGNLAIEFGPIVLFFVIFQVFGFMTSVIILVVAMALSLIASIVIQKRVAVFPIVSSGSVIIFGLLTIFLKNPDFIIIKDTLYFGIFGLCILVTLLQKKLLLKNMFQSIFAISDKAWKIVSWRWTAVMLVIAGSNEFARIFFSPSGWVHYKFFVLIGIFIFSAFQFLLTRRERLDHATKWGFSQS